MSSSSSLPSYEQLQARDRLQQAVRAFFRAQDFLEVTTPVRVAAPAPEEYVDAVPAHGWWLRTSPELHMKRLVAAGHPRLFQLGPCFRQGEHGRRHREEFTMLEWYVAGWDYRQLLTQTADLVAAAALGVCGTRQITYQGESLDLEPPGETLTVHEAFCRFADCTPEAALERGAFELLLVERLEPHLGRPRPTFLVDYPAALAALARTKPGAPHLAERWELYLAGVELANAFGELTDPAEQRRRFVAANEFRRSQGREAYPLDEAFLAAVADLPPCAGGALGLDRLQMLLTDAPDLGSILGQ